LRDDRGAVLVEFALIAPFHFLMLFGIIEFGLTLNDYQSLRQGVREGAREGVVGDYGDTTSCGLNGSAASLTGSGATNTQMLMCTVKERAGLGNELRVAVKVVDSTTSPPATVTVFPNPSGTPAVAKSAYADYKVRVCAAKPATSITGLIAPFLDHVKLESEIEMRLERDTVELRSSQETDPSGGSWSWC
jgi:Flp pilus assembly protein TadG